MLKVKTRVKEKKLKKPRDLAELELHAALSRVHMK